MIFAGWQVYTQIDRSLVLTLIPLTLQGTLCEDDFTLIRTGSSSRLLSKVDIRATSCRMLPSNAFMGMGLTSLTLPDQLETIGDGAPELLLFVHL